MSWLRGLFRPNRVRRDDLEREAAEELQRLTADARSPFHHHMEADAEPDSDDWGAAGPSLDGEGPVTVPHPATAKSPRTKKSTTTTRSRSNGSKGPSRRG